MYLSDETKGESGWSWFSFKEIPKADVEIAHSSTEREGILANRVTRLQFHSFIHSFIQWYFLDAFYNLDATIGAEDSAVNKIYNGPHSPRAYI